MLAFQADLEGEFGVGGEGGEERPSGAIGLDVIAADQGLPIPVRVNGQIDVPDHGAVERVVGIGFQPVAELVAGCGLEGGLRLGGGALARAGAVAAVGAAGGLQRVGAEAVTGEDEAGDSVGAEGIGLRAGFVLSIHAAGNGPPDTGNQVVGGGARLGEGWLSDGGGEEGEEGQSDAGHGGEPLTGARENCPTARGRQ